ncbi:MAG: glycine oxidase ThiO [Polyangiaceae bacterium]
MANGGDVLIVGGGVMGCASALQLAKAGAKVVVLERSVPGAEASSAAAGIIGAQVETADKDPGFELARQSRARYPAWADELKRETGIDIGYRQCGVLRVAFDDQAKKEIIAETAWQKEAGLSVATIEKEKLRALEPKLDPKASFALHFPDDGQVDPPRLLRALYIAAAQAGAEFRSGAYVRAVAAEAGQVRGVVLEDGTRLVSDRVVLAAGSWSTLVEGVPLEPNAIRPARGQMVELETREPALKRIVFGPRCYLVPREDGRILVGSTLEFVGYRREVTAGAIRDLLAAAIELVPSLVDSQLGRTWSNFRPYSDRGRPLIGASEVRGLVLATGHHRNGILLAPVTAEIVKALVLGEAPPVEVGTYATSSQMKAAKKVN